MRFKHGKTSALIQLLTPGLLALCAWGTVPVHAAALALRAPPGEVSTTPRQENAKAQLEHATSVKKAMRGAEGEARERARDEAVRAYRAVREYFAGDVALCAEAAFRAGELLRSTDDTAGAQAEFTFARDRGAGTDFRVRAMLELAHLERRAKHAQPAIAAYESVIAEETATARQKDDARLWLGRMFADLERVPDARRVWQKVADKGDDPLDRIRAFDLIASSLVDSGDLEGAAGMLERCRESLSEVSAEETRLGERVRSSLAAMRSIEQLARAIEKRRNESETNDSKNTRGTKPAKRAQ
ncbi:MAG: hypothetical protein JNL28_02255 [Planctomycetes bacterium]|nr:hypothetical protein [Planctomycetota bacterium]